MINVPRTSLSRWETETSVMDVLTASKIADYFNVSLDFLTGRDSFPHTLGLSPKEYDHIKTLRGLKPNKQHILYDLAKALDAVK